MEVANQRNRVRPSFLLINLSARQLQQLGARQSECKQNIRVREGERRNYVLYEKQNQPIPSEFSIVNHNNCFLLLAQARNSLLSNFLCFYFVLQYHLRTLVSGRVLTEIRLSADLMSPSPHPS